LSNIKRLGRYIISMPTTIILPTITMITLINFNALSSLYKENSFKPLLDWNKPLFGNKRTSLQEVLANANKAIEKSTKFINKIKSRQLACANRAKLIPENATIRKEYIKCGSSSVNKSMVLTITRTGKILKARS
jgi:hypothetical protein